MGAYLDKPKTEKHYLQNQNKDLEFCCASMQGWRLNMEDAEVCELSLENGEVYCFGVFDGHGGSEVAKFVSENFIKELKNNKNFQEKNYGLALKENFMKMDELLFKQNADKDKDSEEKELYAGCTSNVILITKTKIYCANAGDSRSILISGGKTTQLSFDHKPENTEELARIRNAGGDVYQGRVNGNLNLSRAIGDLEYKQNKDLEQNQQLIIAEPDIEEYDIAQQGKPDYIVMGCDGIWEELTCQEVANKFENKIKQTNNNLKECVTQFLDECIAQDSSGMHGLDNMTCILIKFAHYNK